MKKSLMLFIITILLFSCQKEEIQPDNTNNNNNTTIDTLSCSIYYLNITKPLENAKVYIDGSLKATTIIDGSCNFNISHGIHDLVVTFSRMDTYGEWRMNDINYNIKLDSTGFYIFNNTLNMYELQSTPFNIFMSQYHTQYIILDGSQSISIGNDYLHEAAWKNVYLNDSLLQFTKNTQYQIPCDVGDTIRVNININGYVQAQSPYWLRFYNTNIYNNWSMTNLDYEWTNDGNYNINYIYIVQ